MAKPAISIGHFLLAEEKEKYNANMNDRVAHVCIHAHYMCVLCEYSYSCHITGDRKGGPE